MEGNGAGATLSCLQVKEWLGQAGHFSGCHPSTPGPAILLSLNLVPTSGLHGQVGHDLLGANDVNGLALVLALVMQGHPRDPECARGQNQVPPVHGELAPCKGGCGSHKHRAGTGRG